MIKPPPSDPAEIEQELWADFKGELAFDVGAHVGESLFHLTKRFTTVVAFEPAHESFRQLKADWGDREDVYLRMEALSDHRGTLETSMREMQMTGGQLVATGMPYKRYIEGITPPTQYLPWGREIGTRTVPTETLDWIAGNFGYPDFCKIDTEGHEAKILAGAKETLTASKTSWLIEFHLQAHYTDCMRTLIKAGYSPSTIRHPHYAPGSDLYFNHGWIKAASPGQPPKNDVS